MVLGSNTSGHIFDTSFTTNGTLYSAASGVVTSASPGNAGEVWTSNGAGSAPTFQAAGGGGSATGFYAYVNANITNATGNNVIYDIIFNATLRNDNSVFNTGTGVFTADQTGIWTFQSTVYMTNITNGTVNVGSFKGSVVSEIFGNAGLGAVNAFTTFIVTGSFTIPMTAGDTMAVQAFSNEATQTVTVGGAAIASGSLAAYSTFSGFFVGS